MKRRARVTSGTPGQDGVLALDEARALENHLGGTSAVKYRRYQYDLISPHLGRSLLEVGAGLGEFSEQLTQLERLVLTDTDPLCLTRLSERFAGRDDVTVAPMDLDGKLELEEPVETVLAMNVLEHIEDDVAALRGMAAMTTPGGNVVLWVPAYMQLYGEFDRLVGHYRRYTPKSLTAVVKEAGLVTDLVKPVNLLGGIAWWAAVRRGGAQSSSSKLVDYYDRFVVPMTRTLEKRWTPPFGQTVLCVARKPDAA
jgi:SAM-dependent methyltransferase